MKEFFLDSSDGKKLHCVLWECKNPVAILQISHGMMEYVERYGEFANFLNENNIVVLGNDHRGHGKTAESKEKLGITDKKDTYEKMIDDITIVTNYARKNYPGLPVILFGHSFGSFLAQGYISKYGKLIDGVILSGTSGKMGVKNLLGLFVSGIFSMIFGSRHKSKILNYLVFAPYNKYFKPNRTKIDWLCSVEIEVDRYIEDEYCGKVCSVGFFYNIFKCLSFIHSEKALSLIKKDLPILLIEGEKDPVGGFLKNICWLVKEYVKRGINFISVRIYSECRHECLNEKNKIQVYNDILNWIKQVIGK